MFRACSLHRAARGLSLSPGGRGRGAGGGRVAASALTGSVSTVDWIVADILAVRQNALGHVRYVLKDGLKWLPLYGCYFSQVMHFLYIPSF